MSDKESQPETIEGKWVAEKESLFTPLTGKMVHRSVCEGEYTCEKEIDLNGENIKPGAAFQLEHGDTISVAVDSITPKDLKWRFRDEDE